MKSLWLEREQVHLRYHDLGEGDAPLLFIHGLGCASSCDYPTVAADPSLRGRRLLLVDLLGSGFSDRPADFGYGVDHHAQTIAELVRSLALPTLDLFGHSMGGSVAIVAAGLLKGQVKNLLLGEPNLDPGGGLFSRRIAAMSEADYLGHGHGDLVRASRSQGNGVWAASLAASSPLAAYRGAASLVAGGSPAWRERLYALPARKTVIFGSASLPDPDTGELPRHGVSVEIVADAGHSMAWENPAGLARAIKAGLH